MNLYQLDEKTCVLEYQKIMGDQLSYQKKLKGVKEDLALLFEDKKEDKKEVESKEDLKEVEKIIEK